MLLHYNLYLALNSIIIIDNASIYRLERIRQLYKAASVRLKYLLLYLLDYNPIKKSFKYLKS